jgi:hypothetical protein
MKRFGLGKQNRSTENLIAYLNGMERKYAPTETSLLVALGEIETIDFPRLRDTLNRDTFPFSELLLVGVQPSGKFVIAGILPKEGWSTYDLGWVMN